MSEMKNIALAAALGKKRAIASFPNLMATYELAGEYIVNAGTGAETHTMEDGGNYFVTWQRIQHTESNDDPPVVTETVVAEEVALIFKPHQHQGQVIFGTAEHIQPEPMPDEIQLDLPGPVPPPELDKLIQKELAKCARNIMIIAPNDLTGSDYIKARVWRIASYAQ